MMITQEKRRRNKSAATDNNIQKTQLLPNDLILEIEQNKIPALIESLLSGNAAAIKVGR